MTAAGAPRSGPRSALRRHRGTILEGLPDDHHQAHAAPGRLRHGRPPLPGGPGRDRSRRPPPGRRARRGTPARLRPGRPELVLLRPDPRGPAARRPRIRRTARLPGAPLLTCRRTRPGGPGRHHRRRGRLPLRHPGARHRLRPVRAAGGRAGRGGLLRLPHHRGPAGDRVLCRRGPGGCGGRRRPARAGGGRGAARTRPGDPCGGVRPAPDARSGRPGGRRRAAAVRRAVGRGGPHRRRHQCGQRLGRAGRRHVLHRRLGAGRGPGGVLRRGPAPRPAGAGGRPDGR